jgi:hypothetical protein
MSGLWINGLPPGSAGNVQEANVKENIDDETDKYSTRYRGHLALDGHGAG